MTNASRTLAAALAALLLGASGGAAQEKADGPIAINVPKRDKPVDFRSEVFPILKSQCLACHHAKEPEGGLILESPRHMIIGGDNGPAVVPGKGAASLLVQVSARTKKPHMPPKKNKVDARPLTSEQLGLIQLWIDQGAKDSSTGAAMAPPKWQSVAAAWNPVYAVALDAQGLYAACGRAGRLHIYHVPSGRLVDQPVDPKLAALAAPGTPGLVDRDAVYALAFSPDGSLLATGGYRSLKLWKREAAASEGRIALPADVKVAALSADGRQLAVAGADPIVRVFDLAAGRGPVELKGHAEAPAVLRFSPDGTKLLSGSNDKSVRIWKSADGAALGRLESPVPVTAAEWTPAGLATAGADGLVRLWALPDAKSLEEAAPKAAPVKELKAGGPVAALAASPAGLLVGAADGKISLWNLETGAKGKDAAHGAALTSLHASPDGRRWLSVGGPVAILWNAETAQKIAELRTDGPARAKDLAAQARLTFAGAEVAYRQQNVKTLEENKKKEEDEVKKATEALPLTEKALKEKEEALAKTKTDREAAEKALADVQKAGAAAKARAEEAARLLAAGPAGPEPKKPEGDGAGTAARKQLDTLAKVMDAAAKKADEAAKALQQSGEDAAKKAAAEAAKKECDEALAKAKSERDGAQKALEKADQEAQAYAKAKSERAAAQKALETAKTAADAALKASDAQLKDAQTKKDNAVKAESGAMSALDGARLNLESAKGRIEKAKDAVEKGVKAIAEANQKVEAEKQAQKDTEARRKAAAEDLAKARLAVRSAGFLLDGALAAIGDETGRLHLFGAEKGVDAGTIEAHPAQAVLAVGVAGASRVSVAADGTVRNAVLTPKWTLAWSVEPVEAEQAPVDRVLALAFSPDGRTLASGGGVPSREGELVLWNAADGKPVKTVLPSHSDSIFDLAFSPDGTLLASGGADRFARVFDVASGKVRKSFEGHTHHVLGVSWNRTGRTLASCGADEVVKVWNYESGQQIKTIPGFAKQATALRYPGWDGSFVVASGGAPVRLVNEGGNVTKNFEAGGAFMYDVAVSGDGLCVAAGGLDGTLRIWRMPDGLVLGAYPAPTPAAR